MESVDKGGNFIGWLYIEGKNLSLSLVEVSVYTSIYSRRCRLFIISQSSEMFLGGNFLWCTSPRNFLHRIHCLNLSLTLVEVSVYICIVP